MKRQKEAHTRSLHGPAMVCATLANIHDSSGRGWTTADFLPGAEDRPGSGAAGADEESFANRIRMINGMCGGTITEE